MNETGPGLNPERESQEPTVEEIAEVCKELLGPEVGEDFEGLVKIGDALGLACGLLIDAG